jgi:hypothetical protein
MMQVKTNARMVTSAMCGSFQSEVTRQEFCRCLDGRRGPTSLERVNRAGSAPAALLTSVLGLRFCEGRDACPESGGAFNSR